MSRQLTGAAALVLLAAVGVAAVRSVIVPRAAEPDVIEQALDLEEQGRTREAESLLLDLAAVDRRYAPRWTLANFYFRQGRLPEFWRWAREALVVGRTDLDALMDLCWTVSGDGAEVWRVIPERLAAWRTYLNYLGETGRWLAAAPVVEKLASNGEAVDARAILDWIDKMAEAGQTGAAVPAWNKLCQRRWIACAPVAGGLVNGDLQVEPVGRGLDWRFIAVAGVTPGWSPGEVRFQIAGSAPASMELLWQPFEGGRVTADFEQSGSVEAAEWLVEKGRLVLRCRRKSGEPGQLVVKRVRVEGE